MKTLNNTLFLTLLLFLAVGGLEAQKSGDLSTTNVLTAAGIEQYVPSEGDHIDGEAILSFETAQTNDQKQALERKLLKEHNVTIKEWSPSGKYVLLNVSKAYSSACGFDGDGNEYGLTVGLGDQYGLNYKMSTNQWDEKQFEGKQSSSNCLPVNYDPTTGLFTVDYSSYSPTMACRDISQVTPEWTNPFQTRPRVAIIDSGIKNMGSYGNINGSRVTQKAIPDNCSVSNCNYTRPSLQESRGFNSHGRFITTLITGWFRINGLENRLTINSYKVLDSQLKCGIFQVVKAIELATADRNHIISLSLNFAPHDCKDTADPFGPFKNSSQRSILYNAIKAAQDAGLVIITSAGNGKKNLDKDPVYPAAETGLSSLVTVGALKCGTDQKATYSNYSAKHVDLFTSGNQVSVFEGFNCLRTVNGTSFACPIVTAKAAFHVTMQSRFSASSVLCSLRGESRSYPGYAKYGIVDTSVPRQRCSKSALSTSGAPFVNQTEAISEPMVLAISPNPFNDRVTISTPKTGAFLTIIDARGARVLQREVREVSTTLELGNLKPGVYWVNVRSEAGTETRTIIKQ